MPKVSRLPSATLPLSGAELVPLVQNGVTVQTPVDNLPSGVVYVNSVTGSTGMNMLFSPTLPGTYRISYWVNVTGATAANLQSSLSYYDENGNLQLIDPLYPVGYFGVGPAVGAIQAYQFPDFVIKTDAITGHLEFDLSLNAGFIIYNAGTTITFLNS
jgi:hypothetical protein